MIDLSFITHGAPIIIFIISSILIYCGLLALKVPGASWLTVVLSIVLALTLAASDNVVDYLFNIIPYLTLNSLIFYDIACFSFYFKRRR